MLQIRYDPVKNQRIAYATKRLDRTFHPPKEYCPLCPTKEGGMETEIPKTSYNIVVFENKFPAFSIKTDNVLFNNSSIFKTSQSKGICEVVCYSAEHDEYLEDQPIKKIKYLIRVLLDRYIDLGSKDFIKYVFIFENKGKENGVTLTHPHGQIYGFPYIPPIIKEELINSKKYFRNKGKCLHCDIINEEVRFKDRIIKKNRDFISFIPFYARWPYEVQIYSLRHFGSISDLRDHEITSLAEILKDLINKYNKLFKFRMPYVMVVHQNPTDGKDYFYYHFHFEFYPPYRTYDKLKYLAGCELGVGTFINDTLPELKAEELRG